MTHRLGETEDDSARLGAYSYLFGPRGRVGGYEIERQLGSGAMGTVFVAKLVGSEVHHALKVHSEKGGLSPDRESRFMQEAQALASLRHPGIVRVHTCGLLPGGQCYFTMDLVEGRTLADELEQGNLGIELVLRIGSRLAAALAYLHEQGVVHRDLKPDNVILRAPSRDPVLVDFGVARVAGAPRMTRTGQLLGTPLYMAPEQIAGERIIGAASDVFALGGILYQLLSGKPPFEGDSLVELAAAILGHEPAPLGVVRQDVPSDLAWLVERCLAKRSTERPDAAWVARALASLESGQSIRRRTRRSGLLGAGLLLSGVGISIGLLTLWRADVTSVAATEPSGGSPALRTPTRDEVIAALKVGRIEHARRLVSVGVASAERPDREQWQRLEGVVSLLNGEFDRARDLLPLLEHPILALEHERTELEVRLRRASTGEPGVDAPTWAAAVERLLQGAKSLRLWPEDERALVADRVVATTKFYLLQMPRGYFQRGDWESVVAKGESLDPDGREWNTYRAFGRWFSARNPREEDRAAVREILTTVGSRHTSPLEKSLVLALQILSAEELSALMVTGFYELEVAAQDCPFSAARVFCMAHSRVAEHWRSRVHTLLEAEAPTSDVAVAWRKAITHAQKSLRFGLREKGPGRIDGIRFQLTSLLLFGGRKEEARHVLSQFAKPSNWKTRLLRLELALLDGNLEGAEAQLNRMAEAKETTTFGDALTAEAVVLSLRGRPEEEIERRLGLADERRSLLRWRNVRETRRELAGEGTRQRLITWLGRTAAETAKSR